MYGVFSSERIEIKYREGPRRLIRYAESSSMIRRLTSCPEATDQYRAFKKLYEWCSGGGGSAIEF